MTAQHTPGKWHHTGANEYHGNYVEDDHGNTLCDLYHKGTDGQIFHHDNAEANARLISAAPDLLEALQVVIANWTGGSFHPAIEQACQAIAKATGVQPCE